MVIVDDSAVEGVFEKLVEEYGEFSDIICFPRNRTQWWAMDFLVSYCDSKYIFYLEDDWEFLRTGYLNDSKAILENRREVGVIDISMRTFEWQGIDSYDKNLIELKVSDDYTVSYFNKKPWQITPYHLYWYGWCGSPNLKRRDDLILLGRVEKWHNEWNIDRKFLGLGFKAVFLNGKYVEHLGDTCSAIANRRPDDSKTPNDYYPQELLANSTFPQFDYRSLDRNFKHPHDITLVSMMVDLNRSDRTFDEHYLEGVKKLLDTRHRLVLYCEEKYFDLMQKLRGDRPLHLVKFDTDEIERYLFFYPIQNIITKDEWINQSAWMINSVIKSRYYVTMTLMKQMLLNNATNLNNSNYFYWIDSGIYNSYHIQDDLNQFYFIKIPNDKFFITSYPYYTNSEIHGYNINGMIKRCGVNPNYVCRATLFGGTKEQIHNITDLFYHELDMSINDGYVGTEESIYTILSVQHPENFRRIEMLNGDIKNYLNTLK